MHFVAHCKLSATRRRAETQRSSTEARQQRGLMLAKVCLRISSVSRQQRAASSHACDSLTPANASNAHPSWAKLSPYGVVRRGVASIATAWVTQAPSYRHACQAMLSSSRTHSAPASHSCSCTSFQCHAVPRGAQQVCAYPHFRRAGYRDWIDGRAEPPPLAPISGL